MKIVHLTSAHARYDIRIFKKQCISLSQNGFHISLIVADGLGDETVEGIKIFDVGKSRGRLQRFIKTTIKVFQKGKELNGDLYHIHDPELIPVGLKLKRLGKMVIFDAHEEVAKQLLSKPYLNKFLLKFLSVSFSLFEKYACRKFDAIIAATPVIKEHFLQINPITVDINNFPIIGELESEIDWESKKKEVIYIGGISEIRGIKEMVKGFEISDSVKLNLVGDFFDHDLKNQVSQLSGWKNIKFHGFLERGEIKKLLASSIAGLVIFHPVPNHVDAQPNKMFEYMSSGIPIITSNFPLWKEIVEGNNCGICVDPLAPGELRDAVRSLNKNRDIAEKMGRNGLNAVKEKYNWATEEGKLVHLYQKLLS